MQIKTSFPWLISGALVALALWLFFKLVDQSITLDHQTQFANTLLEQRNMLVNVLSVTAVGKSENEVRKLLHLYAENSTFDKGKDEVIAAQVSFFFQDGRLVRVDAGKP